MTKKIYCSILSTANPNRLPTLIILSAALFAVAGCQVYKPPLLTADYYYLNGEKELSQVNRVALIKLENNTSYPQITTEITRALHEEIQKKQLFSLVSVSDKDPEWNSLQIRPQSDYSLPQLNAIRDRLECDAILLGTITQYKPYPHLKLGLRLWLLDLKEDRLLWAVENIWDTADKNIYYRINNYFDKELDTDIAPLKQKLMSVSSLKFYKFVAYEASNTLRR